LTETEQERKVREYWANAYKGSKNPIYDIGSLDLTNNDNGNSNSTSKLPYEPTAVLTHRANNKKQMKLSDILDIDLTR
jgi:hypothetical protein